MDQAQVHLKAQHKVTQLLQKAGVVVLAVCIFLHDAFSPWFFHFFL